MKPLQKRGLEGVDGVHVEVVKDARQDDPPHRRQLQHGGVRRFHVGITGGERSCGLEGAAYGFGNPQRQPREQKSGDTGEQESCAPTQGGADGAGAVVSETKPGRQSEHEYAHGACTLMRRKQIADQRLTRGCAACFTQPHPEPRNEQLQVVLREAGGCGQQAPDRGADGDETGAIPLIRQAAERQAHHGVHQRGNRPQQAERGVAQVKFLADRLGQGTRQLTIEEIQQVDCEENEQRIPSTRESSSYAPFATTAAMDPARAQNLTRAVTPNVRGAPRNESICPYW